MGKGDNPMEQWRKKEKKKQQRKNVEDRVKARSATMMAKDPDKLLMDIKRIQMAERQGTADAKMIAVKKRMLEIHHISDQKRVLAEKRKELEKGVVVKGLTKLLGKPVAKPSSSSAITPDESSAIRQDYDATTQAVPMEERNAATVDDDGIPVAPPNLAPPRPHVVPPWIPTQPLPQPQSIPYFHQGVLPQTAPVVRPFQPAQDRQHFRPPPMPRQSATISAPASVAGTEFLPTNMMLGSRRQAVANILPKRRKLVPVPRSNAPVLGDFSQPVPPITRAPVESVESAYGSFMAELGE
uniref:Wbp11/ELF5/Saf1 N-terminal domain-containing protein n=1 Tax=Spongospora subterranea TaxID=70186 RepID=A0A0H5QHA2_9EUKA|eukprot:CRZ01348.1 hypothetical protein [Spongospora subterranea]